MMGYLKIAQNKASLNCGRLNTAMLSQNHWYMSESTHVVSLLGLEGDVKRQRIVF